MRKGNTMGTWIRNALFLKRTLGTRIAAGYLRNRTVHVEVARAILATPIYKAWA